MVPVTKRILLADDCDAELELMRYYLEAWPSPLHIECATDGRAALELVAASPAALALVVIDCKMPVLDGVEAVRRMRELPGARALPIVMWSGSADPGDLRRAYGAGVNSYLRKPSTAAQAREMVQMLVRYWAYLHCPPP